MHKNKENTLYEGKFGAFVKEIRETNSIRKHFAFSPHFPLRKRRCFFVTLTKTSAFTKEPSLYYHFLGLFPKGRKIRRSKR